MKSERFETLRGFFTISFMFVKRFVFLIVSALLAIAGNAGASFEAIHHDEERCLICESATHPAAKMPSTRNSRPLKEIAVDRQIVREDSVEKITSYRNLCLNDTLPAARFRVLLI
jgi:hypothetical protein